MRQEAFPSFRGDSGAIRAIGARPRSVLRSASMSGRSAVRLARLVWDQEVGGSNPPAPTISSFRESPVFWGQSVCLRGISEQASASYSQEGQTLVSSQQYRHFAEGIPDFGVKEWLYGKPMKAVRLTWRGLSGGA